MTLIQDSKKQKKGKGCVLKAVLAKGERGTFQTENVLAILIILERNLIANLKGISKKILKMNSARNFLLLKGLKKGNLSLLKMSLTNLIILEREAFRLEQVLKEVLKKIIPVQVIVLVAVQKKLRVKNLQMK